MVKAALKFVKLDDLPLFASDQQIALAVVGPARADHWAKVTVKLLERQVGFPKFDPVHGGRYTPGVRKYYEYQHGAEPGRVSRAEERPEDIEGWKSRTLRRRLPKQET